MSEKQKQAIERLYDLRIKGEMNEEDFYLFLEFVLEKPSFYYGGFHPTGPYYPWWGRTTCLSGNESITTDNVKLK